MPDVKNLSIFLSIIACSFLTSLSLSLSLYIYIYIYIYITTRSSLARLFISIYLSIYLLPGLQTFVNTYALRIRRRTSNSSVGKPWLSTRCTKMAAMTHRCRPRLHSNPAQTHFSNHHLHHPQPHQQYRSYRLHHCNCSCFKCLALSLPRCLLFRLILLFSKEQGSGFLSKMQYN